MPKEYKWRSRGFTDDWIEHVLKDVTSDSSIYDSQKDNVLKIRSKGGGKDLRAARRVKYGEKPATIMKRLTGSRERTKLFKHRDGNYYPERQKMGDIRGTEPQRKREARNKENLQIRNARTDSEVLEGQLGLEAGSLNPNRLKQTSKNLTKIEKASQGVTDVYQKEANDAIVKNQNVASNRLPGIRSNVFDIDPRTGQQRGVMSRNQAKLFDQRLNAHVDSLQKEGKDYVRDPAAKRVYQQQEAANQLKIDQKAKEPPNGNDGDTTPGAQERPDSQGTTGGDNTTGQETPGNKNKEVKTLGADNTTLENVKTAGAIADVGLKIMSLLKKDEKDSFFKAANNYGTMA